MIDVGQDFAVTPDAFDNIARNGGNRGRGLIGFHCRLNVVGHLHRLNRAFIAGRQRLAPDKKGAQSYKKGPLAQAREAL